MPAISAFRVESSRMNSTMNLYSRACPISPLFGEHRSIDRSGEPGERPEVIRAERRQRPDALSVAVSTRCEHTFN